MYLASWSIQTYTVRILSSRRARGLAIVDWVHTHNSTYEGDYKVLSSRTEAKERINTLLGLMIIIFLTPIAYGPMPDVN